MLKQSGQWYLQVKPTETWAYIDELFTDEECDKIISKGLTLDREDGKIGHGLGDEDQQVRKGSIAWFNSSDPEDFWIYQRLVDAVQTVNSKFWKFDLDYIEILQFTIYDQLGDHYGRHTDMFVNGIHNRKLSFSLQLSDPDEYKGSDLIMQPGSEDIETSRKRGSLICFPSYQSHKVSELEQGKRYSLVGWVCGPSFR